MPTKRTFPNTDGVDFSGLNACRKWLTDNGFSHGPIQREDPIAVAHGEADIAKWRHLNQYERLLVDGVIEPYAGGWRGERGGAVGTLRDAVAPVGMDNIADGARVP